MYIPVRCAMLDWFRSGDIAQRKSPGGFSSIASGRGGVIESHRVLQEVAVARASASQEKKHCRKNLRRRVGPSARSKGPKGVC